MTQWLIHRFIKNADQVYEPEVRERYGLLGSIMGIVLNVFLFFAKLLAGLLTASIAITADAFNNLSDAGSSIVTLFGFRMARRPAHQEHPFGHGRIEYIAGLVVAMIIILVGVELAKTSFNKIINPEPLTFSSLSLVILLGSIALKLWMGLFNRCLGDIINSPAMKATATDSMNDVIATSATVVGLLVAHFTSWQVDGYIGIAVALFILWAGYNTAKDTLSPLLGQAPDQALVDSIKEMVLSHDDIIGIHDLIVHNYGPGRSMLSLHAEVPNDVDIIKIHDTIDIIENQLKKKLRCDAVIHMDPILIDDTQTILTREKIQILVKNRQEQCSIHDFRMTKGPTHTNLIFDLVIPYDVTINDQQLMEQIRHDISQLDPSFYAVIEIDKSFI